MARTPRLALLVVPIIAATTTLAIAAGPYVANNTGYRNPTGVSRNYSTLGRIDLSGPFFQSLGTNGRSCATCHALEDGLGLTATRVQQRFTDTGGLDPLFRPIDGATNPTADVSTLDARRQAYAMLLTKGLIRVGLALPATRDFELVAVDDPYRFASAAQLSLFRRPLPATNLRFLKTVMWDGRETFANQTIHVDLKSQANHATIDHAEGAPLTDEQQEAIATFEESLFTAQAYDATAFTLTAYGALGGAVNLSQQPFVSNNPVVGFNAHVFTLYDAWRTQTVPRYQSVYRGQEIFNTRIFPFGNGQTVTCSRCHNVQNAGSDSIGAFFNTGVAAVGRRTPDLPLYSFRCSNGVLPRVTDPGRALVTGRCVDIGKFKIPTLRGLAARAPYFHNGSAATLDDVVTFYDQRFGIAFTAQERADLVAFLRAL